jgi:hypothetical protein
VDLRKLTKAQRIAKAKLVSNAMLMGLTKKQALNQVNKLLRHMNVAQRTVFIEYDGKVIHETVALEGETKKQTEKRVRSLLKFSVED